MMPESFFDDREIFITGGSGVVGKAIIEKLLRSCSVKKIYVLLREKKGVSAQDRLVDLKNATIFSVLKEVKPGEIEKIVAVPGDVQYPELGLSEQSKQLISNVSLVYHSAATVRFDEPIKVAIKLNLGGTLETLKIASTLKKLDLFVHISTFYSNPYLKFVDNKLYPPVMDWKDALKLSADTSIDNNDLDALTIKITNKFPNTYTFTKSLAEQAVNSYFGKMPVVIFRPSIVAFCVAEPLVGFIDTHYGLNGLTAMNGTGLMRTLYATKDLRLDKTPLDLAVKVTLLQTIRHTEKYKEKQPESIPIFHFSSCVDAPYTMQEEHELTCYKYNSWEQNAYEKIVWLPNLVITPCWYYYKLRVFLFQLIPSLLIDLILRLCNIRPVVMVIQRKMFIAILAMHHFLFNNYESDGITDLEELKEMSKDNSFFFAKDVEFMANEMAEEDMFNRFTHSARRYIMKEDDSTIPRSRIVFKVIRVLDYAVRGFFYYWMGKKLLTYGYQYVEQNFP